MIGLSLIAVFLLCVFVNIPVAMALGISSLVAMVFIDGTPPVTLFSRSLVELSDSFPLIALPLFVLAGEIMLHGGLTKRIVALAKVLTSKLPAGLAIVNVVASVFFAAISGSSPATVAAIGSNVIPEMEKSGYKKEFSSALTASSGMIGVLIPPSIPFIVYAVTAGVSVGAMFLAGIIPGIVLAAVFIIISMFSVMSGGATREGKTADNENEKKLLRTAAESFWAILAPVIILGGIYGGIFTPTEASAAAVVYALLVSFFVYKELSVKQAKSIFVSSAMTSSKILALIIFAAPFGRLVTLSGIPEEAVSLLTGISDNDVVILLAMNIMLLVIGMFMETIATIIILTPILLPVALAINLDPVVFGVMLVVNLAIGFCTPPLGVNLFVASAISNVPVFRIAKAILPFLLGMIVVLLAITFVPAFSRFLVEFFY